MLNNPEFWTSLAFVVIIALGLRPVGRYLRSWTKKEDDKIEQARDEVIALCQKAEKLKSEYEKAYMSRFDTEEKVMKEADEEIARLKKEAAQEFKEKMSHTNAEMAVRLKMIEENGVWDLKKQIVNQVLSETRTRLEGKQIRENANALLEEAFEALDQCYQHK